MFEYQDLCILLHRLALSSRKGCTPRCLYLNGQLESSWNWWRWPWEWNHPSLDDNKVDVENFNLESHNIMPRPQLAIVKTGIPFRLVFMCLAHFAGVLLGFEKIKRMENFDIMIFQFCYSKNNWLSCLYIKYSKYIVLVRFRTNLSAMRAAGTDPSTSFKPHEAAVSSIYLVWLFERRFPFFW